MLFIAFSKKKKSLIGCIKIISLSHFDAFGSQDNSQTFGASLFSVKQCGFLKREWV